MSLDAWPGRARGLAGRIVAWIDGALAGAPPEPIAGLLLDIHAWQVENDPVLAALVEGPVAAWTDIPAVPVSLYKDLPVGSAPGDAPVRFHTSGTTGTGRGEHRLRDTAISDHGALAWARRVLGDPPGDVVALLHDPALDPRSSLSHMVASFVAFGPPARATWHVADGLLQRAALDARIRAATGPLFVASTAFALADWLEGDPPALPAGSILMVTGGFKGRQVRFDEASLLDHAEARVHPARIVLEYGMTELSSQLWASRGEPYAPPPWLKIVAVDPWTGAPKGPEEEGQLRFYDLCNLDGPLGVETMDRGVVHADGRLTLLGRLTDAPARGCSLTVEEAWARRGGR